jgi:catechol 2,3-dioxygenase-like lactoylglutathione lyase family enzyme
MAETHSTSVGPNINQIGIVVRDLRSMVATFRQLFGVEGFQVMEWPIEGVDPQATYHGEPGNYRLLLAFATVGNTQIEIVQPLEGQNIYSDFLKEHGPGLHHIRLTVPDFEERAACLEASGIKNIASGTGVHVGSKWAYFDTTKILEGVLVELRKRLDDAGGEGQWIRKE